MPRARFKNGFSNWGGNCPHIISFRNKGPIAKEFVMEVIFDGKVLGKGVGRSKEAAQNAAREALPTLTIITISQERHS